MRARCYEVEIVDSGDHGLDGQHAMLEIHFGPAVDWAILILDTGKRLTWPVKSTKRYDALLCVKGPTTDWRFRTMAAGYIP